MTTSSVEIVVYYHETMPEKKMPRERKAPDVPFVPDIADILVSRRREEPFLIVFCYAGDNVAARRLGMLAGFFEIEIRDEESAYVVNFLASVAKKEFFANVRRDPIESFEAALHKVNLALSELVKHGNVNWLGHLHGAVALLSSQQIHFSVTGEAGVSLFRDGALRSISEGLASPDPALHPLKTFVEIASGTLVLGDRVLLTSPALWTLFTPEDIEKGLRRFDAVAFEQYLRTAMVNELESAGALFIHCDQTPSVTPSPATPAKDSHSLDNVFSQAPFQVEPAPRPLAPPPVQTPAEFIDRKTGHIYVQGKEMTDTTPSPWQERWVMIRERSRTLSHEAWQKTGRSSRRLKKSVVLWSGAAVAFASRGWRWVGRRRRSLWRRSQDTWATWRARASTPLTTDTIPRSDSVTPPVPIHRETANQAGVDDVVPAAPPRESTPTRVQAWLERRPSSSPTETASPPLTARPPTDKQAWLRHTAQHSGEMIRRVLRAINPAMRRLFSLTQTTGQHLKKKWDTHSLRHQWIVGGGIGIVLIAGVFFIINNSKEASSPAPTIPTTPVAPPLIPPSEQQAVALPPGETLVSDVSGTLVALLFLRDTPFAVTRNDIVNLSTRERISTPAPVRLSTAMSDLSTIFLLTENGLLYSYTPSNRRFIENALPLPAGVTIEAIGAYLTYLYVLDTENDRMYRFPRAEGGFGAPLLWFRQSLILSPRAKLTLGETILIHDDESVRSFARGRSNEIRFEPSATPFTATDMTRSDPAGDIYLLDAPEKRVLRWRSDGTLVAQYFSENLREARAITVSPDQKTLLVGSATTIISFPLP